MALPSLLVWPQAVHHPSADCRLSDRIWVLAPGTPGTLQSFTTLISLSWSSPFHRLHCPAVALRPESGNARPIMCLSFILPFSPIPHSPSSGTSIITLFTFPKISSTSEHLLAIPCWFFFLFLAEERWYFATLPLKGTVCPTWSHCLMRCIYLINSHVETECITCVLGLNSVPGPAAVRGWIPVAFALPCNSRVWQADEKTSDFNLEFRIMAQI